MKVSQACYLTTDHSASSRRHPAFRNKCRGAVFFVGSCLLLTSCATFPPPRIEGGRFYDSEHQYSVAIPLGWEAKQNLPDWLASGMTSHQIAAFRILLGNNKTQGLIGISSERSFLHPNLISQKVFEELAEEKKLAMTEKGVADYNYEVMPINRFINAYHLWSEPCCVVKASSSRRNEMLTLKGEERWYVYLCQEDDTCFVSLNLISLEPLFDENRRAYLEVVESLKYEKP